MSIIHKPLHVIFTALLAATAPIQALYAATSTPTSETLLQIYDIAVKKDPALGAAISTHAGSKEKIKYVEGSLYPEVNFKAEIARNREEVETSGIGIAGLNYFDSNNVQLEIKQALYRKDIFSNIDIADSESLVADNVYKLAQQDLIMRVTKAYFDVLSAQDNMRFANAEKQEISRQLKDIKQRFKVGKSTQTDLQEAQASYYLSVAQAITSQDKNQDSLEGLSQLTGQQHLKVTKLSSTFKPGKLVPTELKYWVDLATTNNLQLQSARHTIQVLKHEIERQSADHYPKLDLVAKYSVEETGGRFGESDIDDKSIGLELSIPIYKGGQVSSKVRSAHLKLNEARFHLLKITRAVIRETRKSYRTIMTSINRINALKRALVSSESALAMIKKGYKVGTRTSADIFSAQREVFKSQRDYSADKYNYTINYLQIKNLTGTLTRDELRMINKWFK